MNPTTAHLDDAGKQRGLATEERAASRALRDAEARACVGLSDAERDTSPLEHREDIVSVEPIIVGSNAAGSTKRIVGAAVTFRAVPGMTAQWPRRSVDCRLARSATLGYDLAEMPYGPLAPRDVSAEVTPTGTGFVVSMHSNDSATAAEILRRAQALLTR